MRTAMCAAMMLVILSALPAAGAEEASVLLEKGVYLEETKGDIDGAIGIYRKVVDVENANRKFAAEAGYRLGKCLLRKGDKEGAVSALKAVVSKYPDQTEIAAKASAELRPLVPKGNAPRVVATSPAAFATDVDPATDKITVTFDRPMMDKSWSWTGGGDTFPKGTGENYYDETKTVCTHPAKLEPGKVYWIGINSPSHKNFKTPGRVPAKRYVILFATKTADGRPTPLPDDLLNSAKAINAASDAPEPGGAPSVVSTSPVTYSTDVDPALDTITVAFDQPMDGSYSWTTTGEYPFPEKRGDKPQWNKEMTSCSISVKLEPGSFYWVGINNPGGGYFKSSSGVTARDYVIVFATRGKDGKPTPIPEGALADAKAVNEEGAVATAAAPPRVVETSPAAFATDVDAGLDKITITFDQPMMDKSWSWTGGGVTFPGAGAPSYDETRTVCTLPVKLAAGKPYWVGINSPNHKNFQTPDRVPAERYVILFATKGADGKPTPLPEDLLREATMINEPSAASATSLRAPQRVEPAPWQDGEMTKLSIKMKTGVTVGTIIYTARLVPADEEPARKAWRIDSYTVVPMGETRQFTRVDAAADTFLPIAGRTRNQLGDFKAKYAGEKVTLEMKGKGNYSKQDFTVDGAVYDNEEALYLIRRLPLKDGYETAFQVFPVQSGQVAECRIDVAGKERVLDRDCLKVVLQCWSQGTKALEHTLWFSADEHRYLVKYDAGTVVMELTETGILRDAPEAVRVDDNARVTLPSGWFAYRDEAPGAYQSILHVMPPQMDAWAVLMSNTLSGPSLSVDDIARKDSAVLAGYFENYKVREASWTEAKIDSHPAMTFTADYKQDGVDMVEYRTYVTTDALVYWFVYRVEKDKLEAMKPQFDSVVTSLKVAATKDTAASAAGKGK